MKYPIYNHLTGLALISLLTACGGGGSSSNAPAAKDQTIAIDEDIATTIILNEAASDNSTLSYSISDPSHGSISGVAPVITYTPDADYYGEDSFTYSASDGSAGTVSIVINSVEDRRNFQPARVVLGQPDFTSTSRNQGGAAGANTINSPYGNPGAHNGIVYLPDYSNNRLLGLNRLPTVNNAAADFVLGQPDFSSTSGVISSSVFQGPQSVAFDDNKMFLSEYDANRILIWNTAPKGGAVAADTVLGQVDFASSALACTATGLTVVESISAGNGKLVATDTGNNRVLIWNTIPTVSNTAADIVLGQQDFTHCASNDTDNDGVTNGVTASTLSAPAGVWTDGIRLVVLDSANHRALIWSSFPTSSFTPADVVLGQSNFNNSVANDSDQNDVSELTPTARTLDGPYNGVHSDGQKLFIADTYNNRVLIWNTFPTNNFTAADVVLGQAHFFTSKANDSDGDGFTDTASASTLSFPTGIYLHDGQLIIADQDNNRYLVYAE